ncbi:MAG: hypothetical protein ACRC1K_22015 [Planctomycetia bacterium]
MSTGEELDAPPDDELNAVEPLPSLVALDDDAGGCDEPDEPAGEPLDAELRPDEPAALDRPDELAADEEFVKDDGDSLDDAMDDGDSLDDAMDDGDAVELWLDDETDDGPLEAELADGPVDDPDGDPDGELDDALDAASSGSPPSAANGKSLGSCATSRHKRSMSTACCCCRLRRCCNVSTSPFVRGQGIARASYEETVN